MGLLVMSKANGYCCACYKMTLVSTEQEYFFSATELENLCRGCLCIGALLLPGTVFEVSLEFEQIYWMLDMGHLHKGRIPMQKKGKLKW